ncbi:unnamed protein product [Fraxinus pennsylvanica]|uniref:Uncharacterized protein n=1 Tax=Fraxinus pennsylvanica TaxID=56036 RepID=A0AAD1ZPH7_9LAMI|nr:unnamed protein product [Fraxinus pennsylvanica]
MFFQQKIQRQKSWFLHPLSASSSSISPRERNGSRDGWGELVNYLDLDGGLDFTDDLLMDSEKLGFLENELIQVNVSFMGKCPMVVEENLGSFGFGKVPSSEKRIIRMGVAHR